MFLYIPLIAIFAIEIVAGMPTRRNLEGGSDVVTSGRISSMVIKGIVVGTLLSIGAFLLLYLYRKCLFPTAPPAVPPMYSTGPATSAPSALAPLSIAFNVARASRHISYPPSTAGMVVVGGPSMDATPRVQGGAHVMKTKLSAPVAGPRASSTY
ncbi:hypothetical protein HYPSUDRAFT_201580 [Hypholoma sublateritium FD-334 SS-4]|uniref:Uncharacterized protein n=1 Tax=Hypholoma sublateritium (strain FD-334 SS-4) TaxID=945553 RepID=A0A0D2MI24_HYPSF|nr:hypothetical protein HYPSUDRAFT_201580 [Hypholoma sublateritium FD-334 SS-4]